MATLEFNAQPPEEAIKYFEQKGFKIGFDYRDVWNEAHATAFTAAKAMQLAVLQDLRAGIQSSLEQGTSFHDFKKEVVPLLAKKGWWGKQTIEDPITGDSQQIDINPYRIRRIFDTNMRVAYAEGQNIRIQDSKKAFPYLIYDGCNSQVPRPAHCALDGLIMPVDDPRWNYIMPPNGFGCKCRVYPLTAKQAGKVDEERISQPKFTDYTNPRTGEKIKIPEFEVTDKNGKKTTWKSSPAFSYPPGQFYDHLVEYAISQSEKTPQYRWTQRAIDNYKKLSSVGLKHKFLRETWPSLSIEARIKAIESVMSDIRKLGKLDDTLYIPFQRRHYDAARRHLEMAKNEPDKRVLTSESMYNLGELIDMLADLPESMERVVTL